MLATAFVTAPNHAPNRWVLFLHGILGSGANFRSLARALVTKFPHLGAVLVDLRLHGRSLDVPGPHTVEAAARDLTEIALPGKDPTVVSVLGHSFGGKVALTYAAKQVSNNGHAKPYADRAGQDLQRVLVLDSSPSPLYGVEDRLQRDPRDITADTFQVLGNLPAAFPTRQSFIDHLVSQSLTPAISQWLAMNLERQPEQLPEQRGGNFRFRLDIAAITEMLRDYLTLDAWPLLADISRSFETNNSGSIEMLVGERSHVVSESDLAQLTTFTRVNVHTIANAGHWVHVDAPTEVERLVLSAHDGLVASTEGGTIPESTRRGTTETQLLDA